MELLFVVDTMRFLVAAPPFLNKQPVASQPASQPAPLRRRSSPTIKEFYTMGDQEQTDAATATGTE